MGRGKTCREGWEKYRKTELDILLGPFCYVSHAQMHHPSLQGRKRKKKQNLPYPVPLGSLHQRMLLLLPLVAARQQVFWQKTATPFAGIPVHCSLDPYSFESSCLLVLREKEFKRTIKTFKAFMFYSSGWQRDKPRCILFLPLWWGISIGSRSTSETIIGSIRYATGSYCK